MTARPMLFSGPMVRALLDGRKTQTRRAIKVPGTEAVHEFIPVMTDQQGRRVYEMKDAAGRFVTRPAGKHFVEHHFWPRFAKGDRLWVRETCATWNGFLADTVYRADESAEEWAALKHDAGSGAWKIRPSIHMPRSASRLTLIVTEVRVERLQAITLGDICAEGLARSIYDFKPVQRGFDAWEALWDSINGERAPWGSNPWVCAVTFTVHKCNIDQMGKA